MTIEITETVTDSFPLRVSKNPWINPPAVTREMVEAADTILMNRSSTLEFINSIEGPTKEEIDEWEAEALDIMDF